MSGSCRYSTKGKASLILKSLTVCITASGIAFAQQTVGAIRGEVRDRDERDGCPNVRVTATNERNGASHARETGGKGEFVIDHLQPGTYTLKVDPGSSSSRPGCSPGVILTDNAVLLGTTLRLYPPDVTLGRVHVRVKLIDAVTGEALESASIRLQKGNEPELALKEGKGGTYDYLYLTHGRWRMRISRRGYKDLDPPKTIDLRVFPSDLQMREEIRLKPIALDITAPISFEVALWPARNSHTGADGREPDHEFTATRPILLGYLLRPNGNGVGGAAVLFQSEQAPETRSIAISDDQGEFRATLITPGRYQATVLDPGFTGDTARPFSVRPGQETILIIMQAQTPPAQERSAPGPRPVIFNTTTPTRISNITAQQMQLLPLGGASAMRSYDDFAFLFAGVAPPPYTPGVRGPGIGLGIGSAGEFSVNGMRARANNFSVDGSDNNDPDVGVRRQGFVALVPQSLESIDEFALSTLLWDAELGRNFGSQVNAVSRYGERDYHGDAYWFFTDSKLNARDFFSRGSKDKFRRSQMGLTVGGPLADHSQFFTSFEAINLLDSRDHHFATPSDQERRFLGLSMFVVRPKVFVDEPSPLPEFEAKHGRTPLGEAVQRLYPLPNNPGGPYGLNTFSQVASGSGGAYIFSSRLTHQFSNETLLNARYNLTDDERFLPSVNGAINSTIRSEAGSHNLSLIVDLPRLRRVSSYARFSFGRSVLDFHETPGSPLLLSSKHRQKLRAVNEEDLRVVKAATGPIGEVLIEPFSPVGVSAELFPQGRTNNTFQFADSSSWLRGDHFFKFGADIRRVHLDSFHDRFYRPQVIYGASFAEFLPTEGRAREQVPLTGLDLAMIGVPSALLQTITLGPPDSNIRLRFTELNLFVNDSLRIRPGLTLDFGLRYELSTVPRDKLGRVENAIRLFDVPVAGESMFERPFRREAFEAGIDAYREFLDARSRMYEIDRNDFGPHVGIAWDVGGGGKTVVRAGFGVYYDKVLGAVVNQSRNVFPNEATLNIGNGLSLGDVFKLNNPSLSIFDLTGGNSLSNLASLVKSGTLNQFFGSGADFVQVMGSYFLRGLLRNAPDVGGGLAFTLPAKNLRTPYAQQWHLTVERELGGRYAVSAGYVATKGTRLLRLATPNGGPIAIPLLTLLGDRERPVVQTSPIVEAPTKPNPFLGSFRVFETTASSTFHALEVEARRRFNSNFCFTLAYTWSHAIDDVSDVFPIAGAPVLPQDSGNVRTERASANFDVRERLAASLTWAIPWPRPECRLCRWLGDWHLATIIQAHTGQPFTINIPVDANGDGNRTDRPSTMTGLVFFDEHGPRKVAVEPGRTLNDFFVPDRNGAVGRNTARGDSFVNVDFALTKVVKMSDTRNISLRTQVFNLFNRANFGLPIRVIGAPAFGSAVETVNPARTVEFAVKLKF